MTTSWTGYSVNLQNPSIVTLPDRSTAETRQDAETARLHRIAARISSAAPLDEIFSEIAELSADAAKCDACDVYVADGEHLISRSAQACHPEAAQRVKIQPVIDATGWVAGKRELLVVAEDAWTDSRVKLFFNDPIEGQFESFVSIPMASGGRLVGAINLIDRAGTETISHALEFVGTLGLLAGAEIERVRLASENARLSEKLESRKVVERAKGILQRNLQLNEEDAYLTLQRESRQRRKSMKEVAEAIVLSDDLKRKK
jgi:GAF domain-containing protein